MYTIGIDIGGTNTDIGLITPEGKCLETKNLKTSNYTCAELFIDDIASAILQLMDHYEVSELQGIGVGAPCGNFYEGTMSSAFNLPFGTEVPIKAMLEARLPYKVAVDNDANAAAYGEMTYGGAKQYSNFIMLTIGTGLGSGIVIDRKLLYGYEGVAGELGHTTIIPSGRQCSCGREGCLETYVSIRGIRMTFAEIAERENKHQDKGEISLREISNLANDGDPIALETYDYTANMLAIAMANAQCFSSPEAFFLMGGAVECGDILLEPLKKYFEKHKLFIFKKEVPILKSFLPKNNVALLGAAAISVCEN